MHSSTLMIYSKYSSASKKCLDKIKILGDVNHNINLLCIDNEKIRKQVKENVKIKINSVPTILNVFENGTVEKYENSNCFMYLEQILEQYNLTKIEDLDTKNTLEDKAVERRGSADKDNTDDGIEVENTQVDLVFSSSEDEDEDENENNSENVPMRGIRDGKNNYIFSKDNFGKKQENGETAVKASKSDKKDDLMAKAMAMQKERE